MFWSIQSPIIRRHLSDTLSLNETPQDNRRRSFHLFQVIPSSKSFMSPQWRRLLTQSKMLPSQNCWESRSFKDLTEPNSLPNLRTIDLNPKSKTRQNPEKSLKQKADPTLLVVIKSRPISHTMSIVLELKRAIDLPQLSISLRGRLIIKQFTWERSHSNKNRLSWFSLESSNLSLFLQVQSNLTKLHLQLQSKHLIQPMRRGIQIIVGLTIVHSNCVDQEKWQLMLTSSWT